MCDMVGRANQTIANKTVKQSKQATEDALTMSYVNMLPSGSRKITVIPATHKAMALCGRQPVTPSALRPLA